MRLCLRQLRNTTGYIRGTDWYRQILSALSCEFVQHVMPRKLLVCRIDCHGHWFAAKYNPGDISLQSKRLSEFTWAVERCFLILKELGTHGPRYNAFLQQGRQTVNCKLLLSNRRFPVRSVFRRCGDVLKFIFLNSNHWVGILGFQRSGKLQLFCRMHV